MNTTEETIYVSVHLNASASLADVNKAVAFNEQVLGPLVAMKVDNDTTSLKFDSTQDTPEPTAIVAAQVDGKPQIPEGATLVTSGQILLAGKPTLCAATRG